MTASYHIDGRWDDQGDEVHIYGDDCGGILAFKKDAVRITAAGIEVPEDLAPRLVAPPTGEGPRAAEARQAMDLDEDTDNGLTGFYCICIGPTCYTYRCSDNAYLGICGTNCAYYGCKSGSC